MAVRAAFRIPMALASSCYTAWSSTLSVVMPVIDRPKPARYRSALGSIHKRAPLLVENARKLNGKQPSGAPQEVGLVSSRDLRN
jgi:hypothetical protein